MDVHIPQQGHVLSDVRAKVSSLRARLSEQEDVRGVSAALRRLEELEPARYAENLSRFEFLGTLLYERFERLGKVEDIDDAVWTYHYAVCSAPGDHPDYLSWIDNLVRALSVRFERLGSLRDIDEAIILQRRLVGLTPNGHPRKSARVGGLGNSLWSRFIRLGDLSDIEESISVLRYAIALVPDRHPSKRTWFSNLGNSLGRRFGRLGSLNDLEEAISLQRRALELMPDGHPEKPKSFNNLGASLNRRFDRLGALKDLEEAISLQRRAVEITADGHPDMAKWLNSLGNWLSSLFGRLGSLNDLEEAISVLRRAAELTPNGHPDKPARFSGLGSSLSRRFNRLGELSDLEEAISVKRRAVELTPEGHPRKPARFSGLAEALYSRFNRLGSPSDLEEAISVQRRALVLTPDGHPDTAMWFGNLGSSLRRRFDRLGKLSDLEEVISLQRSALELTPDGHPDTALRFSILASSMIRRFNRLGELRDLGEAISLRRRALELTPDGHPDQPARISNLGSSLGRRFDRLGKLSDLEEAISLRRRALELTPDGHPDKLVRVSNLGYSLGSRFDRLGSLGDLEEALSHQHRALELTPDGHPDKTVRINNLGYSLARRFRQLGSLSDLEEAISAYRRAEELEPDDLPDRRWLIHLGDARRLRFERLGDIGDFHAAISRFMEVTAQSRSVPSQRLSAATRCVSLLTTYPAHSTRELLLAAHACVIDVLPEIVWLGHGIQRRYEESSQVAMLVSAAVSAAIAADSLTQAVEWLEAGRALIWSQVHSLRTPLDDLERAHPTLADSLRSIQQQLQSSVYTSSPGPDVLGGLIDSDEADRHRGLAIQYDDLMKKIRVCPDFEGFLRPKTFKALTRLGPSERALDPVIFINVSSSRCDALILIGREAKCIALPGLTHDNAEKTGTLWKNCLRRHGVRLQSDRSTAWVEDDGGEEPYDWMRVLGTLWRLVVNPILQSLNLTNPAFGNCLPCVTWCPTGPLTQLPLHAAGLYGAQNGPRVYDFVVSSYTPSLSALQRCRDKIKKGLPAPNVLIVAQPKTPRAGLTPLRFVTTECDYLRAVLPAERDHVFLEHEKATVGTTLEVVDHYPWIHFACHGSQRLGDPSKSAFELYDGPLTLAALSSTVSENAELAFLSACQTAKGDESVPEESAHLAAGMLAVGFIGVVATMWTIQDSDAPVIVKAYYTKLLELRSSGAIDSGQTGAALALHEAAAHLRKEVGEEKFERWVPFVHFGV